MTALLAWLLALCVQDPLAITNARVVSMVGSNSEPVLLDHAVLLEDETIRWVGPSSELRPPEGTRIVDAEGAFLVPGLTDAHVHLRHEDELLLNLANGVTSVLNLSGDPTHLDMRDRVRRGELVGPTILTAGPTLDGDPPRNPRFTAVGSPERAFEVVAGQKAAGYDFLKVYDLIAADEYFALVEAANQHDLTIVGHVPKAFGLEPTLEGHRLIAHAEEYYYTFFENEPDESRIVEAVALTADAGVALCPNIGFIHAILDQAHDIDEVLSRPEVRFVHPESLDDWLPENNRYVGRPDEWVRRNEVMYPFLVKLTRAMHDGGVRLMSGTDASIPGGVPGFALHQELDELVAAGLTPHEALATATSNPGDWMREHLRTPPVGRIAAGHRADLVLVDSNPLEGLGGLRRPRAVIVRGRWLDGDELRSRLDELAARYAR